MDFSLDVFGAWMNEGMCKDVDTFVALHADVSLENCAVTETAWGEGMAMSEKGSWAMFFTPRLKCMCDEPIDQGEAGWMEPLIP